MTSLLGAGRLPAYPRQASDLLKAWAGDQLNVNTATRVLLPLTALRSDEMSGNLSVLLCEDGIGYHTELEHALNASFGRTLVIHRSLNGVFLEDGEVLILVVENMEHDRVRSTLTSIPQEILKRCIIFGFPDDDYKEALEQYEPYGLVTSGSVAGWLRSGARPSRMLGNKNGLYGRKEYFDPAVFMEELIGFNDTVQYMIFETIDAEVLPNIIQLYIKSACK